MSFTDHVIDKARGLDIEETPLRVFKVYGVHDTYRVTTDFAGEASCTCPQGKNVGLRGQSYCSHVAAVLMKNERNQP